MKVKLSKEEKEIVKAALKFKIIKTEDISQSMYFYMKGRTQTTRLYDKEQTFKVIQSSIRAMQSLCDTMTEDIKENVDL